MMAGDTGASYKLGMKDSESKNANGVGAVCCSVGEDGDGCRDFQMHCRRQQVRRH
ncbi:hypothetical protein SOM61_18060 [Massilia sp. CFBP9012]|uniref:hypothetical protein n=1 Tax=Massilia sp. CFBP9012 TaxID=3096531 RepID=UPI002A6993C4|nr:hypothetical protein [Massilia sp. CFBP9012]MDY0976873.1 hypothetical protein [Massilia sp. CFBP9012]